MWFTTSSESEPLVLESLYSALMRERSTGNQAWPFLQPLYNLQWGQSSPVKFIMGVIDFSPPTNIQRKLFEIEWLANGNNTCYKL